MKMPYTWVRIRHLKLRLIYGRVANWKVPLD